MHKYIIPLKRSLEIEWDPVVAAGQRAYMKDQFPFFGVKTEKRREITKAHFKLQGLLDEPVLHAVVRELWELPQREFQYTGLELLHFHRKNFTGKTIGLIEHCITHKSWWDSVDALNYLCAGVWFEQYPGHIKEITSRWNRSDNIWLNRSSLLFQLKYRKKLDKELLSTYILHLAGSKEFFIRKAIGWILREYAKTDPEWVRAFVGTHELSNLSKREALKSLSQ